MISDHIKDIMIAYKEKPNSEFRNRAIGHLKDAYALAIVDEGGRQDAMPLKVNEYKQGRIPVPCICPDGAIDSSCPIHGV